MSLLPWLIENILLRKKICYFSCCHGIHLLQNVQHALMVLVYRYMLHLTFSTKNNGELYLTILGVLEVLGAQNLADLKRNRFS